MYLSLHHFILFWYIITMQKFSQRHVNMTFFEITPVEIFSHQFHFNLSNRREIYTKSQFLYPHRRLFYNELENQQLLADPVFCRYFKVYRNFNTISYVKWTHVSKCLILRAVPDLFLFEIYYSFWDLQIFFIFNPDMLCSKHVYPCFCTILYYFDIS